MLTARRRSWRAGLPATPVAGAVPPPGVTRPNTSTAEAAEFDPTPVVVDSTPTPPSNGTIVSVATVGDPAYSDDVLHKALPDGVIPGGGDEATRQRPAAVDTDGNAIGSPGTTIPASED